jgi:hypothetical protein
MGDVDFVMSSESFVAYLNRYAHVSYKYSEGSKMEFKLSDRHDQQQRVLCAEELAWKRLVTR